MPAAPTLRSSTHSFNAKPSPSRARRHRTAPTAARRVLPELAKANTAALFVSDPGPCDVYISIFNDEADRHGDRPEPPGPVRRYERRSLGTDANAAKIYEFSHQGRLEKQLNDSSGVPVGCAWDPGTGDLAVMNLFGEASSSGNILIFPKGGKTPRTITNTAQYNYDFGGMTPATTSSSTVATPVATLCCPS